MGEILNIFVRTVFGELRRRAREAFGLKRTQCGGSQTAIWIEPDVAYEFRLYAGPDPSFPLLTSLDVTTAPSVELHEVPSLSFPSGPGINIGGTNSNSPAHWDGDTLYLFTSAGEPFRSSGPDLLSLSRPADPAPFSNFVYGGRWMEATYKDPDGTLYGWYHFEPFGVCPGRNLTAPKIGAAMSTDNGAHWEEI